MRKMFTIAALTVAALVLGADEASAQRRRTVYPVYQTYTPTYTYGNGVQIATPITTVSGNNWVYGSQPIYSSQPVYQSSYYTPAYSGYYAPTYSNWGYTPTYSNWGGNSGWNNGFGLNNAFGLNSGWNNGFGLNNGISLNSPLLQFGSALRSWIR